jgi:predicted transcriptional regulator
LTTYSSAPAFATKEAIKHIDLPDITSYEEAKEVLSQTTAELLKKNKLDETELHEIHMITYSLEKAVAYLSENIKDDQQASVKEMARLVELVHVSAENNRATETEVYLREYFELANTYSERR